MLRKIAQRSSFAAAVLVSVPAFVLIAAEGALAVACSNSPTLSGDKGDPTSAGPGSPKVTDAGPTTSHVAQDVDAGLADASDRGDAARERDVETLPPLPVGAPVCDPAARFGTPQAVAIPTISAASPGLFGAISGDELSIAWLTSDDGVTGIVHYADRDRASDAFGSPHTVPIDAVGVRPGRVALRDDGLQISAIASDYPGFVSLTRASRSDSFGKATPSEFAAINAGAAGARGVGDPVYAAGANFFGYLSLGDSPAIRLAHRVAMDAQWSPESELTGAGFVAINGKARRPTGLSSDGRTLFYWDDATSIQFAAWRSPGDDAGAFGAGVDLGARMYAMPNKACDRLYYVRNATAGFAMDIVVAAKL